MTFAALFLPIVLLLHYVLKNINVRNFILMAFSVLFYAWGEPRWVIVMLVTVTINYLCGLLISRSEGKGAKRLFMLTGVITSLAFLFFFKYFSFLWDTVCSLGNIRNDFPAIALPIGISFYTFQVLTYTVDVYRGKVPAQTNYMKLLLYISFFPQLIAGPIVNYTDIAPALDKRTVTAEGVFEGFQRFFIGFAKKVLLANTCGVVTEKLLAAGQLSLAGSWLMAVAYAFQIYFDFSGYSDMAIGIGRIFGFHFFENFNYPYISKSATEFWRRWHISLGTFFKDYVYIPLGGNRVSILKNIRNIFVVWLLTGIWHGASWNFMAWGIYYGLLLLAEKFLFRELKKHLPGILNWLITMVLVLVGWVLFYYVDLSQGLEHLGTMFGMVKAPLSDPTTVYYFKYYLVFLVIAALASIPWKEFAIFVPTPITKAWRWLKPLALTVIFLLSVALVVTQSYNPFLYFRF